MFKTLELPGGFAPLAPLPGLCPAPTGGLKRPQDPSPNNFAPPISNSWLRPCIRCHFGPEHVHFLTHFCNSSILNECRFFKLNPLSLLIKYMMLINVAGNQHKTIF